MKLLNIFKTWKNYYAILTNNSLYFYNVEAEEIPKPVHVIPLKNCKALMISKVSFKIESENVNEIIECDEEILDEWIKKIEQVIF